MNRSGGLKFDWDDENTTHIARHNVAPVEVEQVVRNSPTTLYTAIRGGETRTVCCGRTGTGRVLKVIYTRSP